MNILFTALYPMWHYHYVAELNLVQKHLDDGGSVTILTCDAFQKNCEANPDNALYHCARCIGIRQDGINQLHGNIQFRPLINVKAKASMSQLAYRSLDELKKLRIESFDIGSSVYSSLVDRTKTQSPCIVKNKKTIDALIEDAAKIYFSAKETLAESDFDLVYIFNGRYAGARPWMRACQMKNMDFIIHEKSSSLDRIHLFKNDIPHNPEYYPQKIREFWDKSSNDDVVLQQATDFFEERPKGKLTGWKSFVSEQDKSLLPKSWNENSKNVTIFTSSDSEYAAIDDFQKHYKGQEEQFKKIIGLTLAQDPQIQFYIRIHPNSKNELDKWWHGSFFKKSSNCEVIDPESLIASYTLLLNSSIVISSHSSIGLEATYWGKPSIIINRAFYSKIDAVYETDSAEAVVKLILSDPPPKPKKNALKFAAFHRCAGMLLPFSRSINYYTLDFKGKILEARREVHEWLGDCEKRPAVSGLRKWIQDRKDRRDFAKLWEQCDGWFAESPKK
jgi:hypothetical protein